MRKLLRVRQTLEARRNRLEAHTHFFRGELVRRGFHVLSGEHPIVPVMLGEASLASKIADEMLKENVCVIGFSCLCSHKERFE